MISEHTILYLTMWGTLGTALFTLLLAGFALAAWLVSRSSAQHMERQVEETEKAAQSQVKDQAWGRQIEALSKYLSSLLELHGARPLQPDVLRAVEKNEHRVLPPGDNSSISTARQMKQENDRIVHTLSTMGSVWRLSHGQEAVPTTYLKVGESSILQAFNDVTAGTRRVESVRAGITYFIDAVQQWQVSVEKLELARGIAQEVDRKMEEPENADHQ